MPTSMGISFSKSPVHIFIYLFISMIPSGYSHIPSGYLMGHWVLCGYPLSITRKFLTKKIMTIFTPCKALGDGLYGNQAHAGVCLVGGPYSHKALTPGLNLHWRSSRSSLSFIGFAGVREVRHTLNHPMNTRVTLRLEAKNPSFLDLWGSN